MQLDKSTNTAKFRFYTSIVKATKDDNGTRYLTGIASSTAIDRDNERMSEAALQSMKSTAEANLTLFTNHEYKVPDDLFGSCVEAKIIANKNAEPIVIKDADKEEEIFTFQPQQMEVKIKIVSDAVNPKAGQIYRAVEEGVNLGLSIGGVVKKFLRVKDAISKEVHTLIDAIDLYEISLVGIPANAEAMNIAIAKSINGIDAPEANPQEITEIMKKTEAYKEPTYSDEGIKNHLVKELKKCYDEFAYPEISEEEEKEMEIADMNWSRAQAENVLMAAGEKVSVLDVDDHVIHLKSHSWDCEWKMGQGLDCVVQLKHVKKHLAMLKDKMKATEEPEGV